MKNNKLLFYVYIVGLMVFGSMVASMIGIPTPFDVGKTFVLQDTLDSIFPQMLSLGATFFMYWLLKKKVSNGIILSIGVFGRIILSVLGILN